MSFKSAIIRALHNRPKPEIKFSNSGLIQNTMNPTANPGEWTTEGFPNIAQSITQGGRIGTQVRILRYCIFGLLFADDSVETTFTNDQYARVIIALDKSEMEDTTGTAGLALMASAFGTTQGTILTPGINAPYVPVNQASAVEKRNYRILKDKVYRLTNTEVDNAAAFEFKYQTIIKKEGRKAILFKWNIRFKKGLVCTVNNNTTTFWKNSMWINFTGISNYSSSATPRINMAYHVYTYYVDN